MGLPDDLSKIARLVEIPMKSVHSKIGTLRVARGSWGRVNGVSRSQPTLTPPQATRGGQPALLTCSFEQIVW